MKATAATFQRMTRSDWPGVRPLVRSFYAHFGYRYADARQGRVFRRLLDDPRLGVAWLILSGTHPAGYVVLTHGWSIEYGGLVSIVDELYVAPEYRGRGLGRRALRHVRQQARRLGVRKLFLEVESFNRRAKQLYARQGFADTKRTLMRMDVR